MDIPVGVTQEEGRTGFLIQRPSVVLALLFLARRIQPFLSLVDREAEFCVVTNESFSTCRAFFFFFFFFFFFSEKKSRLPGFELTSQRQKVSRIPTELVHGDLPRPHSFGTTLIFTGPVPADFRQ